MVTASIPELWAAGLRRRLYQMTPYRQVAIDYSSTVSGRPGGDKLHITVPTTNVAVFDYTRYAGVTSGTNRSIRRGSQPSASDLAITLSQIKAYQVDMDDIDQIQANQQLFDDAIADAEQQLREAFSDHVRAQMIGADVGGTALPAANKTAVENMASETASEVVTARGEVVEWLFDLATKMDRAHLRRQGRGCFVSPEMWKAIVDYYRIDKPNQGVGAQVDAAFADFSVGNVAGFEILTDDSMPVQADNSLMAVTFVRGEQSDMVFGEQWNTAEQFRSQAFFGDTVRGLHIYQAARLSNVATHTLSNGTIL